MAAEPDALEYESIDHTAANAAFADRLTAELGFRRGRLLDLGSGAGDILVEICRRAAEAEITAVELSPAMLELAAKKIGRAGFSDRVRLLRADAKATGLPAGSFDFVTCSNFIHHVPEPGAVFLEIARLCRTGGGIFLKDLRRPDTTAELNALAGHWAPATPRQRELLADSLHAALRVEEVRAYAEQAGLTGFMLDAAGARHWELRRPARGL
jgi:ubiquinone/menaquinone biosynthesis C-methylase UbiE